VKITFLTLAAVMLGSSFAGAARAQQTSPSPTPQPGFKRQVFQPSSNDPLSSTDPSANSALQTRYDRFTDITTVWISYDDLNVSSHHDLSITAFFTYHGKDATKLEKMGVTFESTPHDWSARLERNELYILADGERISLGRPSGRSAKVNFRYIDTVTEWLEYKMTLQVLKKIAYARKVEMRLDSFEFNLHPGFLRSMQKLISGISTPKTAPLPNKRRVPSKKIV
jgi:hypothetical protein